MKVSIVIPTYNRVEYLRKCLESLGNIVVSHELVFIFVDDASIDRDVSAVTGAFIEKHAIFGSFLDAISLVNKGINLTLKRGIQHAIRLESDKIITLDSDSIVKPSFVNALVDLHESNDGIVSGFNWDSKNNKVVMRKEGVVYRPSCCGINMCFNEHQYREYIEPALLMEGDWDFNVSVNHYNAGKIFAITSPSIVQHIGEVSSLRHTEFITASDY